MIRKSINWGILGLGKIAHKFAHDLLLHENSNLYAVGSRNLKKAIDFGLKYNTDRHYGSYEELVADPNIDVIYIATPHTFHFENAMMCLKNGKSVLIEKPMGIDYSEVSTLISEAKNRNLFLMEAIWTRFIPSTIVVLDLIQKNAIGSLKFVRADFGFKAEYNPEGRVFNKALGGGSLLDIGIYPIYLSLITLGIPTQIKALSRQTKEGVDTYCSILADYASGEKAILESTFEAVTPTEAHIYGSNGSIILHKPFHHSKTITIETSEEGRRSIVVDYIGNGYYHEIDEVTRCLKNGLVQSELMSHQDSLNLMSIIEQVKEEIGLDYCDYS